VARGRLPGASERETSWGKCAGLDGVRALGSAAARMPRRPACGRARDVAALLARTRFNLGYFEHVFLSKIELKCIK
jgi:hypothetical protein